MQIRQLFGFCGAVIGVDRVGDQKQFVFVEYTYPSVKLIPSDLPATSLEIRLAPLWRFAGNDPCTHAQLS